SGVWVIGERGLTDLTRGQSRRPFIGSGSAWPVPFDKLRVSGEYLLLATDGLLKYAPQERILAACRGGAAEADAQCVSGRSKPAREGRMKTSHFEERIALRAVETAQR